MRTALICVLGCLLLAPASALAAPILEQKLDVDGDGAAETVSVQDDGRLVVLASGGRAAELAVGDWTIAKASIEQRSYAGPHRLLLVRSIDADGVQSAALVEVGSGGSGGGPSLSSLWRGQIGPQGRDGEWRVVIELGPERPLLYDARDGVARCDGEPAQLHRQAFDWKSGQFRPYGPSKLAPPKGAVTIAATRGPAPEGLDATMRPSVFRPTAASSAESDGGSAEGLVTPREIDDGRLDTAWAEGRGSDGRGEFVTYRATASGFAVTALRVWPGDAGSAGAFAASNRLRRLHVVTDGGAAFVVELEPDPAGGDAGAPYWIVLPKPIAAQCVSVVLDEVWAPAPVQGKKGKAAATAHRTAIAELAVFTDLEAGGPAALAALAERVAKGGAGADGAEDLLARRGGAGAQALLDAAMRPERSAAERRRLRLAMARIGDVVAAPQVIAGLVEARGDDGEQARRDAEAYLAGLERMGAAAAPALAALLGDVDAPLAARVDAAQLLGPMPGPEARPALEKQCGRGPRELRHQVVRALGHRAPVELAGAIDAAVMARTAEPAREGDLWKVVALLAGATRDGPDRDRAAEAAAVRLAEATAYEVRHRLIEVLAATFDQPGSAAALVALLAGEKEPALRLAAVRGVAAEASPAAGTLLVSALGDGDPAVRAAAVEALAARGDDPADDERFALRLAKDLWPVVRRAAAEALGARCARAAPAEALYQAVTSDGDPDVKRSSLAALVRCKEPRVGGVLIAIVGNDRLGPSWRRFAAAQLGALGDTGLVPRMIELFERERKRAFGSDDAAYLAAALAQALGVLRDGRAENVLIEAALDGTFAPIQAAAIDALAETCPKRAARVFKAGLGAADGTVVRAARLAVKRCRVK